ncbi:MAG: hypothetical protein FJX63_03720 [Alphaproteobacteria bacterium]|nr:hypothetical protein [Alphaproteobacteria bacterium]
MIDESARDEAVQKSHDLLERKQYAEACKLLLDAFDGKDPALATQLGYIYSKPKFHGHDLTLSESYYRIGAEAGDDYAQQGLGAALRGLGREAEGLDG